MQYNVHVVSLRKGQEVSVNDHVWPACVSAHLRNTGLLVWESTRLSPNAVVFIATTPLAVDTVRWREEIRDVVSRRWWGAGTWVVVQQEGMSCSIGVYFFLQGPPHEREVWNAVAEGFATLWGVPRRGDTQYVLAREQASLLQLAASFLVIAAPVDTDTWAKDMESCLSGVYGFDCQVTIEEEV